MLPVLWSFAVCVLHFLMFAGHVIWQSNFLPPCWLLITSHVIFSMPSNSVSNIPNSAASLPGTRKNIYIWVTLSLSLNLTVQLPICSFWIVFCFYIHITVFSCVHLLYCWFGKLTLEYIKWQNLPTAPVLALYTMQVCLWLVLDSSLVNITDFTQSRLSAQYWGELQPNSPTYARFPNLLYTAELCT